MEGAKAVVTESSTSITLPKVKNLVKLEDYNIFEIDSFTKYSILKCLKDDFLYAKNTNFGWMKCDRNVLKNFSDRQIIIAENKGNNVK